MRRSVVAAVRVSSSPVALAPGVQEVHWNCGMDPTSPEGARRRDRGRSSEVAEVPQPPSAVRLFRVVGRGDARTRGSAGETQASRSSTEPFARRVQRAGGGDSDRWPQRSEGAKDDTRRACCRRVSFEDGDLHEAGRSSGGQQKRNGSSPTSQARRRLSSDPQFRTRQAEIFPRSSRRVLGSRQSPSRSSPPPLQDQELMDTTPPVTPQPTCSPAPGARRKRKWENIEDALREAEKCVAKEYGVDLPVEAGTFSGRVARLEGLLALRPAHGLQIDRRIRRIRDELQPLAGGGGGRGDHGSVPEPASW